MIAVEALTKCKPGAPCTAALSIQRPSPDAWILVLGPDVLYQDGAARKGGTHNALPEVLASSKFEHSHAKPGCCESVQSLQGRSHWGPDSQRPNGQCSLLCGTHSGSDGLQAKLLI